MFAHPEQRRELLALDSVRNQEIQIRHKSGELRWTSLSVEPIILQGQEHLLTILRDITAQKQAETTLRESEERFRTAINYTYDWEYWVDSDTQILFMSPSCERITGRRAGEFLTNVNLVKEIVHPDDLDAVEHHMTEEFEREGAASLDFRIITDTGEIRLINHICQSVYGMDGRRLGRRVSNRDITERRHGEEKLMQAEKRLRTGQNILRSRYSPSAVKAYRKKRLSP